MIKSISSIIFFDWLKAQYRVVLFRTWWQTIFESWNKEKEKRLKSYDGISLFITFSTILGLIVLNPFMLKVGLGSIGTTSMDRQSRKIDVQHERTLIAELDTAPPTSIVFPTPKIQKSLPYSLKRPPRWAGHRRPPLKLHYDRYYRAR